MIKLMDHQDFKNLNLLGESIFKRNADYSTRPEEQEVTYGEGVQIDAKEIVDAAIRIANRQLEDVFAEAEMKSQGEPYKKYIYIKRAIQEGDGGPAGKMADVLIQTDGDGQDLIDVASAILREWREYIQIELDDSVDITGPITLYTVHQGRKITANV